MNGFVPFPANDPFNQNISSLPVDPSSSAIIGVLYGASLHPDFGSGTYDGAKVGIPYEVVNGQPLVPVTYTLYGSQSDMGPMPIPANAPVEGAGAPGYQDHHVLILDQTNCFLYELYLGTLLGDGGWTAGNGAVWDLLNDNARPYNWTSADAAGLPIFPGLIRYDEVASGEIRHAIRFTVANTRASFTLPAVHDSSSSVSTARPGMGARFRLKADFDISGYSAANQVILKAMKTYGLILADNGSNMYLSGAPDPRWNNDDLAFLGNVKAQDFDLVTTGTVHTPATVPTGTAPEIGSLTATAAKTETITSSANLLPGAKPITKTMTMIMPLAEGAAVAAGTPVTLSWSATGASYYVVSPGAGAVRGTSVVVRPTQTTTYTLYANSHFGSTTRTFTVTVP